MKSAYELVVCCLFGCGEDMTYVVCSSAGRFRGGAELCCDGVDHLLIGDPPRLEEVGQFIMSKPDVELSLHLVPELEQHSMSEWFEQIHLLDGGRWLEKVFLQLGVDLLEDDAESLWNA